MNGFGRGILGAAIGAVTTLLIHPVSRPYVDSVFVGGSRSAQSSITRLSEVPRLPEPKTRLDQALWMRIAANRIASEHPLKRVELESALVVADRAAGQDFDNAYWKQMEAVFLFSLGRGEEAKQMWLKASKTTRWNDYQTRLLVKDQDRIPEEIGGQQAWPLAYLFYARSDSAAVVTEYLARRLLDKAGFDKPDHLLLRVATVRNGSLLRDGSHSIRVGVIGADIVEIASQPSKLPNAVNHKRLFLARLELGAALERLHMGNLKAETLNAYQSNDAWVALTQRADSDNDAANLAAWSVMTALGASAALAIFGVGAFIFLMGRALQFQAVSQYVLRSPAVLGIGGVFGVLVYVMTLLPLVGLSVGLCFAFVALSPKNERSRPSEELGPFFNFAVCTLSLTLAFILFSFLASETIAANAVLPLVGWPREYLTDNSLYLGLGAIVVGLLFLISPMWAFANRVPTSGVLSLALRKSGYTLALVGLTVTVVGTPLAVYADRAMSDNLKQLLENEPVYYLLK